MKQAKGVLKQGPDVGELVLKIPPSLAVHLGMDGLNLGALKAYLDSEVESMTSGNSAGNEDGINIGYKLDNYNLNLGYHMKPNSGDVLARRLYNHLCIRCSTNC